MVPRTRTYRGIVRGTICKGRGRSSTGVTRAFTNKNILLNTAAPGLYPIITAIINSPVLSITDTAIPITELNSMIDVPYLEVPYIGGYCRTRSVMTIPFS